MARCLVEISLRESPVVRPGRSSYVSHSVLRCSMPYVARRKERRGTPRAGQKFWPAAQKSAASCDAVSGQPMASRSSVIVNPRGLSLASLIASKLDVVRHWLDRSSVARAARDLVGSRAMASVICSRVAADNSVRLRTGTRHRRRL